jgi:hypothetical protein
VCKYTHGIELGCILRAEIRPCYTFVMIHDREFKMFPVPVQVQTAKTSCHFGYKGVVLTCAENLSNREQPHAQCSRPAHSAMAVYR